MNTRIVAMVVGSLMFVISAQAQWLQTNGPHNDILTFGGNVSCLASIGIKLFAGESGLLLSTDSGTTWTQVTSGLGGLSVGTILVSGDKLFVGTTGGLFLSTDSGTAWNLLPVDNTTIIPITSISVSGSDLVAASRNGFSSKTFFSTNGGVNWNVVGSSSPPEVTCLAAMNGYFYAGSANNGVFLSTDNGMNWTSTTKGPIGLLDLFTTDGNLLASAKNGVFRSTNNGGSWDSVGIGLPGSSIYTFAVSGTNLFAGTFGNGVYLSTNNGSSWSALADNGLTNPYISSLVVDNGNLYTGTGGGVFLSTDNGTNWTVHNPLTLITSQINNLDTIGGKIYACTSGGLFFSNDSGATWTIDSNGMGNASVTALAASGGNLFVGTNGSGVFLSTNQGVSWAAKDSGLSYQAMSVTTLIQNNGNLYAGSSGGLSLSINNGASWSSPEPAGSVNSFVVLGKNLVAGAEGIIEGIYYSTDSGVDWFAVSGLPLTKCNALAISGNDIYAGISGSDVWVSTDSGLDWIESANSGLSDPIVTTLLASDTKLFAGTNTGRIFVSSDSAASWNSIDSGFPRGSEVTSLAIKDSILYAGTTDTGIWRHSLAKNVTRPSGVVQHFHSLYTPAPQSIIYPNPASEMITVAAPGQTGQVLLLDMMGRTLQSAVLPSSGQVQFDVKDFPTGIYFIIAGNVTSHFIKE